MACPRRMTANPRRPRNARREAVSSSDGTLWEDGAKSRHSSNGSRVSTAAPRPGGRHDAEACDPLSAHISWGITATAR